MSRTKEYIDDMMESGIDVLAVENFASEEEYFEKLYAESLIEMNELFSDIENFNKSE